MNLEFAFLADSAQIVNGKFYTLGGGIDRIKAPVFPCTYPVLSLAMLFLVHPTECEKDHILQVGFVDADGKKIRNEDQFLFNIPKDPKSPTRVQLFPFAITFTQVVFPKRGFYEIQMTMDARHLKTLSLELLSTS